jgi:hypothetical protein
VFDALTAQSSRELCEQLRMVLEPTKASKLKGDFRTGRGQRMYIYVCICIHIYIYIRWIYMERCCAGCSGKRINLKKVIPYIASQYRWSTNRVPLEYPRMEFPVSTPRVPLEYPSSTPRVPKQGHLASPAIASVSPRRRNPPAAALPIDGCSDAPAASPHVCKQSATN